MATFETVYRGRAIKFRGIVTMNGVKMDTNGGTVTGGIGRPSSATINVSYDSVTTVIARAPVTIDFQMEAGNFSKTTRVFEGELAQIGRDKHEQNRSITLTCEGYSAIWFRTALYLINQLSPAGISYGDQLRSRSVGDAVGYGVGQRLHDLANLYKGDLPSFIRGVLARTHQSAGSGTQALSRVVVLDDNEAATLFKTGTNFRDVFVKLIEGQASGVAPVMTFLQNIMGLLYYEMIDRPGPAPGGRILFKPRTIFTPVPAVNVFRPENYSHFRENRSLVDAPTRMMFQTNAFMDLNPSGTLDITTLVRFAPSSLQDKFDSLLKQTGFRTPEQINKILSSTTEEESRRGIVAEYGAVSQAEWLLTKGDGAIPADAALGDLVEYKLRLKQLEYRSATINHKIDPDIALGFPGAVVDDKFNIFGLVSSLTHSFGVEGVSTNIGMTYTRFDREVLDIVNPTWMSSAYSSGAAYGTLTGSGIASAESLVP